jgi:predicted dehydrogenase
LVKIGVIGCGAIGPVHCDAINGVEGAKLVGVCDVVQERAKALGEKYGVKAYTSLKEMLDHVDAVTVAVPSGYHAKVGIQAAKAGKHVFCEKPIDVSVKAGEKLIDACKKSGVTLTVVSQHRFAQDVRKLREAAQNDGLGQLVAGDAYIKWFRTQAYYDSGDWRGTWKLDGGGCLMNQGVHYVDMIQWVMGGVKSVQAQVRTATHERIEVEDVAQALIEYKNGATGIIYGSTSMYPGLAERMEVHGRYGTVIVEGDRIKVWQVDEEAAKQGLYGGGVQKQPAPNLHVQEAGEAEGSGASDPSAIWGEQHRLQMEDFVQAITDKRDPFITGEMALEPVKVILAIYKSARNGGKRVEV